MDGECWMQPEVNIRWLEDHPDIKENTLKSSSIEESSNTTTSTSTSSTTDNDSANSKEKLGKISRETNEDFDDLKKHFVRTATTSSSEGITTSTSSSEGTTTSTTSSDSLLNLKEMFNSRKRILQEAENSFDHLKQDLVFESTMKKHENVLERLREQATKMRSFRKRYEKKLERKLEEEFDSSQDSRSSSRSYSE